MITLLLSQLENFIETLDYCQLCPHVTDCPHGDNVCSVLVANPNLDCDLDCPVNQVACRPSLKYGCEFLPDWIYSLNHALNGGD